ncbi:carbonyl reductase [NADPH] 1-like [Plodia interpunctella]|uniref:carbonyl reductase [NADPH] 1-like n=1 Tax=Plodia interpunctella TaxID=58824 RepID=UPI00236876E3|nr:carbonyl reductase [NADPH] 1-like [Plodia interpunctella]
MRLVSVKMPEKVAVVTGSNKGLGFSTVKGLCQRFKGVVYLTSRDEGRGRAAVAELNKLGLKPVYHQLDVANRESVKRFSEHLKKTHGGIDILVNNAAVANSKELYNSYEESKEIVDINYYSILTIQEFIFPLVRNNGRIVNISSDCGHLSNVKNNYWIERLSRKDLTVDDINEFVAWYLKAVKDGTFDFDKEIADGGTVAAYRVAKVALSALTMLQQKDLAPRNISVNSMHPGLVKTDMTIGVGFYSADQAAETPLYLALEAPQELRGAYIWYDRKVLDWYDYKADYYFKSKTLNMKYDY